MGEPVTESFGHMLRYYRTSAALGQEMLAERAGMSARSIRSLEAGDRSPRLETVRLLADALALSETDRARLLAAARPELAGVQQTEIADQVTSRSVFPALPMAPTRLVGRETAVAKICDLLRGGAHRFVTLIGPGGVGKTRIALAAASELAADFTDGAVFIDLSPIRDPDLVAPILARGLGVPEGHMRPLVESLCDFVAQRSMLIVLDNCEQVLPGVPIVARMLAASPSLSVLATSRERLHLRGERAVPVEPLAVPEIPEDPASPANMAGLANVPSVRLFLERAEDAAAGFALTVDNARTVAEICRRLEGLPLAVELAAAHTRHQSVDELLGRLDRSLPLLADGPRDLPERQQTMRNTVAWSYNLLAAEEQLLFRRLSVFAGGFTEDAVNSVCDAVAGHLESLVDKSLVQPRRGPRDATRFFMLETVQEFAREQLEVSGEEVVARDAHVVWLHELTDAGSRALNTMRRGDVARWLSQMQIEQENLSAAFSWLEMSHQWSEFLRLVVDTVPFWASHMHARVGRSWLERALGSSVTSDIPRDLYAQGLRGLGRLAYSLGDYATAEEMLTNARLVFAEIGDADGETVSLRMLGGVAEYRGDEDLSESRYEASLNLARASGNSINLGIALDDLADSAFRRRNLAEARRLADESVATMRGAGASFGLTLALVTLGEVALASGDTENAAAAFNESLSLSWDMGYDLALLDVIALLSEGALRMGQPDHAASLLGAVRGLADARGIAKLPHHGQIGMTREEVVRTLGEEAFEAAWRAGQAMSLEQAVLDAMELVRLLAAQA